MLVRLMGLTKLIMAPAFCHLTWKAWCAYPTAIGSGPSRLWRWSQKKMEEQGPESRPRKTKV